MTGNTGLVNVLLLGAGEINFGSCEGPWNHSLRLERALGNRLNVIGIIDPDTAKSERQINTKLGAGIAGYATTHIWSSLSEAVSSIASTPIELVIVGIPPHFRGGITEDTNLDLRLLESLPQVKRWLIEKPVSSARPSTTAGLDTVAKAWAASNASVAVGYHLTALQAVKRIHEIIKEKGLCVMATQGRMNVSYEFANKPYWWNKTMSCGPIVEQATHLASLSLLFGGKADLSTVRAHSVHHDVTPGQLSKMSIDEDTIPASNRIPRYTSAVWKYESGAVGSLSHSIALHGTTWITELEIITDGCIIKLHDFYSPVTKLVVMQDGNPVPEVTTFENDDPYQTQLDSLLCGKPICTYEQALETYALTWAIRLAEEAESGKS